MEWIFLAFEMVDLNLTGLDLFQMAFICQTEIFSFTITTPRFLEIPVLILAFQASIFSLNTFSIFSQRKSSLGGLDTRNVPPRSRLFYKTPKGF